MSNVLKVQITGQRYRYEVMQVVFDEDNDWLKDPKELTQGEQRDFLRFNDNRLDISDYEYFDHQDAGVVIRHTGEIYYELGKSKGKMPRTTSDNLSKNQNSFYINNGKRASPTIQNEI